MRSLLLVFRWALALALCLSTVRPVQAEPRGDEELIAAFAQIRANTTWPVQGGGPDDIEETFGPRRQPSNGGAYDWHRGIDIDGGHGHNIVAALDGEFFRYTNSNSGGWTVILKHTFPQPVVFKGKTISLFYTHYLHLDDSGAPQYILDAQANGTKPAIKKGDIIGLMGNSGTGPGEAYAVHLHFELRVGTQSSLEFQLANVLPTSPTYTGFDPHVHPMLLFPPGQSSVRQELSSPFAAGASITNLITLESDDYPVLNRVEVELLKDGATLARHLLDNNQRDGFDATSTAALDSRDFTKPYYAPLYFEDAQTNYQTAVVLPAVWLAAASPGAGVEVRVTTTDIYGQSTSVAFPTSQPRLSISGNGAGASIDLPVSLKPGVLQQATRLAPNPDWQPVAVSPVWELDHYRIPVAAGPTRFFRMIW